MPSPATAVFALGSEDCGVQVESNPGQFGLHWDSKGTDSGHARRAISACNSFVCSLIGVVARDGLEPPTPAFSGLLTDTVKRFGISVSD